MKSQLGARRALAATVVGVLVGGGLMSVTPAGAEVATAAATSWKKIWKKELKPLADKRYYTKKQSDSTFATKTESAASAAAAQSAANSATDSKLGGYYTKAQADAKYSAAGSSYTKAESDAKYEPFPGLIRGVYLQQVAPNTSVLSAPMDFGIELATAPTTHYIPSGAAVPAGCSGTVAAPNASPGHLCVFESGSSNVSGQFVFDPAAVGPGATTFGGAIAAVQTNAATASWFRGSWVLRPAGLGVQSPQPVKSNEVNTPVAPGTVIR